MYGKDQPDVAADLPSLRPTNRRIRDVDSGIKATAQNAKTVKRFINCVECLKPRVSTGESLNCSLYIIII